MEGPSSSAAATPSSSAGATPSSSAVAISSGVTTSSAAAATPSSSAAAISSGATTSSSSSRHDDEEKSDDGAEPWSWSENKVLELALAFLTFDHPDLYEKIAAQLPGRSPEEVKEHCRKLLIDVLCILVGLTKLPDYPDDYYSVRSSRDPRLHRLGIRNVIDQARQRWQEMQREGTSNQTAMQQSQEIHQESTGNAIVQTATQQSQEMQQEGTSNAEEADAERTK